MFTLCVNITDVLTHMNFRYLEFGRESLELLHAQEVVCYVAEVVEE